MYSQAERLVGEAHVHHAGGVALGGGEVDQAALAEHEELAAVAELVLLDERAHLAARSRPCDSSAGMLISSLKWPELATIAPSFIASMWCAVDDVDVAGER